MFSFDIPAEFVLIRDFAIIMAVAGAAVVLFRRLKLPPILGYLVAGVLVGPFTFPKPPVEDVEIIRLLAELGLVLLLYTVGLEFGWRRIRQVGLTVLLIGTIEMLLMVSVGYQAGRFLGWTTLESIFLGAALSISSSAILVKVLVDTGRLTSTSGKLIVGILVVEDFAAVIMLTLLSGVASTGTADLGDIGELLAKLAIFGVAALALGAVAVHRIVHYVAKFRSTETMILVSLALCFSLALLGQSLGLSAAAGAFLVGAIIGDTDEAEVVTRSISPIRDMFGAVFFVSIGMLINVHTIPEHLLPALIISVVFILGKVVANTLGSIVAGRSGRVALHVGMGMPQVGEFSLAMVKVGVDYGAIGGFVYQLIAVVTAVTSLVYPYLARSADRVADFFEKRSPALVREYAGSVSGAARDFRRGLTLDQELRQRVRGPAVTVLINVLIIAVVVEAGTFVGGFAQAMSRATRLSEDVVGLMVGGGTLLLCVPSALAVWFNLRELADAFASYLLLRRGASARWVQERLRGVLRDSLVVLIVVLVTLWSLPFIAQLLSLGSISTPLPFILLALAAFLVFRALRRVHGFLVSTFSNTFLGGTETAGTAAAPTPAVSIPQAAADEALHEGHAHEVEGQRRITSSEAEIIALSAVGDDRTPYQRRLGKRLVTSEVKDVAEHQGYYKVTLTFRAPSMAATDVGEEEVYVDHLGHVRVRQIKSWPPSVVKGHSHVAVYAAAVVAVAAVIALVVLLVARGSGTP